MQDEMLRNNSKTTVVRGPKAFISRDNNYNAR